MPSTMPHKCMCMYATAMTDLILHATPACRFTEGTSINLSLLMLGSVVSKLSDGRRSDQFIPYRNSKLTRLLQV